MGAKAGGLTKGVYLYGKHIFLNPYLFYRLVE